MSDRLISEKEVTTKRQRFDDYEKNLKERSGFIFYLPLTSKPGKKNCPFKKIYPTLLGQIFKAAFTLDRFRAELVSKHFEYAVLEYGWTAKNARQISWKRTIQSRREMEIFEKSSITNDHIVALLTRGRLFLQKLDLGSFNYDKIIDGSLFAFFNFTPNIKILNLGNVCLEPSHLNLIAVHLSPKLKEVHFCRSFSAYNSHNKISCVKLAFRRFFIACTKLEKLRFENVDISFICFDFLPKTLRSLVLVKNSDFLQFNLKILNDLIISIENRCADHLETLKLCLYGVFSTNSIPCNLFNKTLPKLTKLKTLLFFLQDKNVSLSLFVPSLQYLEITDDHNAITDDCLHLIANICQSIHTLKFSYCYSLTAEGLQTLAKLPKLVNLNLIQVNNFSDEVLKAIARRGKLEKLQISDWRNNCNITDAFIYALSLKSLKLENHSFSEAALVHLSILSKLTHLSLIKFKNLTDQILKTISSNGILKKLDVSNCKKISDESIIDVIVKCKSLVYLNVSYCSLVTGFSLDVLNAKIERRYGVGTKPSTRWDIEKQRFQFVCCFTQITEMDMINANKWINIRL